MKTIHAIVEGRVQGVCFRDYTKNQAHQLRLNGWVRNKRDGTVETVFTGTEKDVQAMLEWLKQGSPSSRVDAIHARQIEAEEQLPVFEVRY